MMKVERFFLLVLAMLCLASFAVAEEPLTEQTVLAALESGEADGWRIPEVSGPILEADGTPYKAINYTDGAALMVLQKDGKNVLCLLEQDARNQWKLLGQSEAMLHQGVDADIPYVYCEIPGQFELYFDWTTDDEVNTEIVFIIRDQGGWFVRYYSNEGLGVHVYAYHDDNHLVFTDAYGELTYTVRTAFESAFDKFSLAEIAETVERTMRLLPTDERLSEGYYIPEEQYVEFPENQKYEVYAAPGEDSYRPAKGKASVSTNGGIEVYGETQGWLLIRYEVSRDQRRMGYIRLDALPLDTPVRALRFGYQPAVVTKDTTLTDDPAFSRNVLRKLPAGTEVICLAQMADWSYVEATMPDGKKVRGFVLSELLESTNG